MKDLLAYLYGGSQIESEVEETREAIEQIMEAAEKEEPLKPKRTPLVAALKSLGLEDVNDEVEYDPEGFVLVCDEETEYRRYVKILMEPDAMEKLAKMGWVVTRCGDVAMANELPEMRIRFIEITTCDGSEDGKWPAPNPELIKNAVKKGREFMDEPGPHDEESPVEYDDKTSSSHKKGVGKEKDGADPEGKPKGSSKKESLNLVDQLLRPVNEYDLQEGRHKDGCTCNFCKNMGKGFKKKDDTNGKDDKDGSQDDSQEDDSQEGDSAEGSEKPKETGGSSSGSGTEATSVFNIEGCARCGQTHEKLIFERLESPVRNLTHWAECPNTGQPILMRMVKEDLAQRKGRPKAPIRNKPVAKAPKASMKVAKAYKTPKK